MSDLKGRSIASTYKNLLQSSSEISNTTLKQVQSGSGNDVAMKLSTDKAVFPKVGIGNTGSTPDGLLHVLSTSAGSVTANSLADEIVLESSTNTGLSILSGASSQGNMFFGDANDNDVGKISYNHADDSFSFSTNGSVSMTLDRNSNLRVSGVVSQSDDRFQLAEYFEKVPSLGITDAQVTQTGGATSAVTLNAKYGLISMDSVDLAATDTVQFTFNNAHIYGATSQVLVTIVDSSVNTADNAMVNVMVLDTADGSCNIRIGTNGTDIAAQVFKLFFVIDPYITPNQNFVLGGTSSGSNQVSVNAGRPTNGFAGIKLVSGSTDNDFIV